MKFMASLFGLLVLLFGLNAYAYPRACGTGYPTPTVQDTLHSAIASHDIVQLRTALTLSGVKLNYSFADENDCTPPLFDAIGEDQPDMIRLLIQSGADVRGTLSESSFDERHFSPMMWAAKGGSKAAARELLTYANIDLNFVGDDGRTALYLAIENRGYEIATQIALQANVEVNTFVIRNSEETPLIRLIGNFWYPTSEPLPSRIPVDTNLIRILALKNGDFINSNKTLTTPIRDAVWTGDHGILDALFSSTDLNPFTPGKDGSTGLDEAIWVDNAYAVRLIISHPKLPQGILEELVTNEPKVSAAGQWPVLAGFAALFESTKLNPNAIDKNGRSLLERYASEPRYVFPLLNNPKLDVNINNGGPLRAAKFALATFPPLRDRHHYKELQDYVAALEALGAH